MWGGRGTVVVPRVVGWRSGVAAVFRLCYNKRISKDPFGHHHYHYRGALYSKDKQTTWKETKIFSNMIRFSKFQKPLQRNQNPKFVAMFL